MDLSWILAPKLGPDLTDGTPYTINLHVFLRTRLVQGACQKLPKFLGVPTKLSLTPLKPFRSLFGAYEKPYKCIGPRLGSRLHRV